MFTQQICVSQLKEWKRSPIRIDIWLRNTGVQLLWRHMSPSHRNPSLLRSWHTSELAKFWPFQETSYPSPKKTNCGYVGYWMIRGSPKMSLMHNLNMHQTSKNRPSWDPIVKSAEETWKTNDPPPSPYVRASFQRGCQTQDFLPAEITHWYERVSTGKKKLENSAWIWSYVTQKLWILKI